MVAPAASSGCIEGDELDGGGGDAVRVTAARRQRVLARLVRILGGGVVGITGRIPDVCLFVRVLGRVDIEVNLRPLPDVFNGEDVVELIKYIQYFKNSDE